MINQYRVFQIKEVHHQHWAKSYAKQVEDGFLIHHQNYQSAYKGKPAPSDTPMTARKRLEEKRPNTFVGRSFGVGDVIVWDEEKGRKFFYVDKEELVEFGGFMDADAAGNTVVYMVPNYQIDGKTGTWLPYDSEVVEGVCFFMMRNEQRKDAVSPIVVDSKGVFVTDAPNGFENVRAVAFINEEVYNGLTLDDERIRQAIIEFRPRLVVIDPIQAYLGSDSDLQIAGRARKLMRRLGMWAAGYDCAIVLIGHLNKKEGSKGLYRSLGSIDVVAAARSVLQVERDTENPDIRIVHQIKNSLAPTAEDIRFSISADKGFRWLECRPQLFEKQQPDAEPKFDTEQQKAAYWIKHFLEKGDMSANEIYCRLDNEGISKRVARMVKTEMGIHCYQKKRRWYWSVQPEEGAVNGPQA